ncbi:MAG: hypothetical protein K2O16_16250 [Lachnospiraceae bacterium]|nr:hypothetical protein [Lachnospiraceae bacterium]
MKQLKKYAIIGIFFVLILGTLSHFLYEWTGNNLIVGFFTPVSESVWEHMKLLFFPMLLYSIIMFYRYRAVYPCIFSSFCLGILLGTTLIPILFYIYTAILGHNIFILDIAVFIISTVAAFFAAYKFTLSCKTQPYRRVLYISLCIAILCFILFTCNPPRAEIFDNPAPSGASPSICLMRRSQTG